MSFITILFARLILLLLILRLQQGNLQSHRRGTARRSLSIQSTNPFGIPLLDSSEQPPLLLLPPPSPCIRTLPEARYFTAPDTCIQYISIKNNMRVSPPMYRYIGTGVAQSV